MARDVVDDFLALLHGSDVRTVDGLASKDGVGSVVYGARLGIVENDIEFS